MRCASLATGLLLLGLGWARPAAAACPQAQRVVVVPFEWLAIEPEAAREAESLVRAAALQRLGDCLEPRKATVERMRSTGAFLSSCTDDACRARRAATLQAGWVMEGIALGVGGRRTVSLWLWGPDGRMVKRVAPLPEGDQREKVAELVNGLWSVHSSHRPVRVVPLVVLGAAAAAGAGAVAMGLSAKAKEEALSRGMDGCPATGDEARSCLAAQIQEGRQAAMMSNVLSGVAGVLGAAGVVSLVWEWP